MPPNFLPLVGNNQGDWLCLRVGLTDPDGQLGSQSCRDTFGDLVPTDVVHWYHGGGDWLPWGDGLAEALLFDWSVRRLPSGEVRHADPAESSEETAETHAWGASPIESWMEQQLGDAARVMRPLAGSDLVAAFHERDLSHAAVVCQEAIHATPHDAGDSAWVLDRCLRNRVETTAERFGELAWPHELLGQDAMHRGSTQEASRHFTRALLCSRFTDQSVRLKTSWATSGNDAAVKFPLHPTNRWTGWGADVWATPDGSGEERGLSALHRLPVTGWNRNAETDDVSGDAAFVNVDPSAWMHEYVDRLVGSDEGCDLQDLTRWLIRSSETALARGLKTESLRLAMAAGWDVGAEPLRDYGGVLEHYARTCEASGYESLSRLGWTHRRCFRARYGV